MVIEGAGGILDRTAQIGLDLYWRVRRFEYSGGDVKYIGCNEDLKAPTSESTWVVWKYSYTSGDVSLIEGPITGAWDNRATMGWN